MTSRVDLHCHSTASQTSRLGVQRSLGLPECATPPEEVYELAKRRGMDFVTITDHDTIAGCLELDGCPDCFVSEELTARFAGEPQAVHILCYGITPGDHEWLQANSGDVEACAAYLHENEIACALAHPFFNVAVPLTRRHRRRLAELFPIWEVRNGSRAAELNMPAAVYVDTHGGTGIGGSDDHAGVDIGRTFTEVLAAARTPEEFLRHLRAGDAEAGGEQGSAAKWTHAAMALATRALVLADPGDADVLVPAMREEVRSEHPDPGAVLKMAERVSREGAAREGKIAADLGPDDARCLLEAWLQGMSLDLRGRELIAYLQGDLFSHADLYRRARRIHERRLRSAADRAAGAAVGGDLPGALNGLFEALVPAVPYAPSTVFLGAEKAKLANRDGELPRVAVIADGIGSMHGVTHTIEQIRERGVPGFEVEVIGTDPSVDRRLPSVAELEMPFYEGMAIGVPGLPDLVETLADGAYDLIHVTAPGPAGVAATLLSRVTAVPLVASYHTELAAYASVRSGDEGLATIARVALGAFYRAPDVVLSPSPAADGSLVALGAEKTRIGRWERGVDTDRFHPSKADPDAFPGELKVLYAGRLTREKGVDLLAESFLRARRSEPRLHLLLAGGGPEEGELRQRLGEHATFLGWLGGEDLARAYASADAFLFASATDTYGQVILEAGASGLPVVAVAAGGPAALVENRHTGLLCRPDPDHLAGALLQLASSPLLRSRLGTAAVSAARARSWERALGQLADGYGRALEGEAAGAASAFPRRLSRRNGGGASVRWIDRRSRPLLQPRALLARLQPAGSRTGGGPRGTAAGAAALLRDLRLQPRRVLHGPGRRPVRPARCRHRRPWPRRPRPERADRRDPGPRAGARRPAQLLLWRRPAPGPGGARAALRHPRQRRRGRAARDRRPFPRAGFSGADAAGDRPRPSLSLHLQPLAQPRRAAARSRQRHRDHRPGQGSEGAARSLPPARPGRQVLRAAGGGDRRQPRRALPRNRGDRPRLLPGHPRRRLHRQRRGRRPAAGGPGRDSAAAVSARSCASRSRPG